VAPDGPTSSGGYATDIITELSLNWLGGFAQFVAATGYVTEAESFGFSAVFRLAFHIGARLVPTSMD
jgi:hypothetical protein